MKNFTHEHVQAANGLSALAKRVGVRYQAVQHWLRSGRVPAARVIAVEAATGVSRHRLRPDLYPAEAQDSAA